MNEGLPGPCFVIGVKAWQDYTVLCGCFSNSMRAVQQQCKLKGKPFLAWYSSGHATWIDLMVSGRAFFTSLSFQHEREHSSPQIQPPGKQLSHCCWRQLSGKGGMEGQDAINLMNNFSDYSERFSGQIIYSEILQNTGHSISLRHSYSKTNT